MRSKRKWTEKRDMMKQSVITFEQFSQALLKKELSKQEPEEPEDGPPRPHIA